MSGSFQQNCTTQTHTPLMLIRGVMFVSLPLASSLDMVCLHGVVSNALQTNGLRIPSKTPAATTTCQQWASGPTLALLSVEAVTVQSLWH